MKLLQWIAQMLTRTKEADCPHMGVPIPEVPNRPIVYELHTDTPRVRVFLVRVPDPNRPALALAREDGLPKMGDAYPLDRGDSDAPLLVVSDLTAEELRPGEVKVRVTYTPRYATHGHN